VSINIPASQFSRRHLLIAALLSPALLTACQRQDSQPQPAQYVDLLIESDGDLLAFKPTELSCPTGAHVRLTFRNTARYVSFEHNWVLILPHTFDAVTKAALAAGEENGWVPPGDKRVLAATALCGKGQQAMVEFIAPAPGDYPFICSSPGHAENMWGILHVTAV
jgi:azurin